MKELLFLKFLQIIPEFNFISFCSFQFDLELTVETTDSWNDCEEYEFTTKIYHNGILICTWYHEDDYNEVSGFFDFTEEGDKLFYGLAKLYFESLLTQLVNL